MARLAVLCISLCSPISFCFSYLEAQLLAARAFEAVTALMTLPLSHYEVTLPLVILLALLSTLFDTELPVLSFD